MLVCHACNTRFDEGEAACPSCGRRASEHAADVDAVTASGPGASLPPARPMEDPVASETVLDEREVVDPVLEAEVSPPTVRRKREPLLALSRDAGPAAVNLAARQIRALVSEQPDLLEAGLQIYQDAKKKAVGVAFETPLGEIDILAQDSQGQLVVVMIPDVQEIAGSVSGILQRIGWVRKHLAGDATVRGVVIVEQLPEAVGYEAAGLADVVSFKTVRVSLTFQAVDI